MRTFWIGILFFGIGISAAQAQKEAPSWEVQVSTDSLLMGNQLKVSFILKNGEGRQFEAPNFVGFQVVGGPNQSSSMTVINGQMSRESSYSYYLMPVEEGNYYIEPAIITIDGAPLETPPLEVIVFPNPDGVKQPIPNQGLQWNALPWEKPEAPRLDGKKKRKIYRT